MPESNVMMEVSSNQGYTGHQIHVCNFAQQWEYYFAWDTKWASPSLTIAELLTSEARGGRSTWGGGLACVSNLGNFATYTGHVLAAANTYACGRMAWDPTVPAATVDREWAAMTFPAGGAAAVDAVANLEVHGAALDLQDDVVVEGPVQRLERVKGLARQVLLADRIRRVGAEAVAVDERAPQHPAPVNLQDPREHVRAVGFRAVVAHGADIALGVGLDDDAAEVRVVSKQTPRFGQRFWPAEYLPATEMVRFVPL